MFKLEVFGIPQLTHNTTEHQFKTAFPLLIATYIVVEHKGNAKRSSVYDFFFPRLPTYPQNGSKAGKIIYENLWEQGKSEQVPPILHITRDELKDFSNSEIESACQAELKEKYRVIENYQLKTDGLSCWLTTPFKKYLASFFKDSDNENSRELKNQRTCQEHIRTLRRFLEQPAGDPQFFTIDIACTCIELEQALDNDNFEQIKAIYHGAFLADIEKRVRTNVWLSPKVYEWLDDKRKYVDEQVEHSLWNIVQDFEKQADDQRFALVDDIRNIREFCNRYNLNDSLKLEIEKLLANTCSEYVPTLARLEHTLTSVPTEPFKLVWQDFKPPTFPHYLRNHLLAKVDEICDLQLKHLNKNQDRWINLQVSVKCLKRQTTESFHIQPHQPFFKTLFEQSFGFMVLLGDAGMGKSLALYTLVKQLVQEARQDIEKPIPLIFHLADWATQASSFEKWLKQELVQLGWAEKNIAADFELLLDYGHCVFFLDGFDNLVPEQRLKRLHTINQFIQKHGEPYLGGVVIASRPDEYQLANQLFLEEKSLTISHFHTEATLQALSVKESNAYVMKHVSSSHLPLDILFESKTFKQLLSTPLGLTLFIDSTNNQSFIDQSATAVATIKDNLVASYVQGCFKRVEQNYQEKRQAVPYTEQEVTIWLGHIARSMNIGRTFLVEGLLPENSLNKQQQHVYQWGFTILFGLIFGAMMGGIAGLIFGTERVSDYASEGKEVILPDMFMGVHNKLIALLEVEKNESVSGTEILISKIELVIYYASLGMVCAVLMSTLTFFLFKRLHFSIFLGGYLSLHLGLTGWLTEGGDWMIFVIIFYGSLGVLLGLLVDAKHTNPLIIELQKDTRLSYERFFEQKQNIIQGALFVFVSVLLMSVFSLFLPKLSLAIAILQGIAIGVSFTFGYIIYRLRTQADWQDRDFLPRQKIKAALKRSVTTILLIGGFITFFITVLGAQHLKWPSNLSFGLRSGMPIGIIIGFMFYGGVEVLKHVTLRLVMYWYGIGPWHYNCFLEYTKSVTLLKPQSSGYAFKHDWFQEYFMTIPKNLG